MAPGRVNLIGEHTDYNDGLVLPVALGVSTRAEVVRGGAGVRATTEAEAVPPGWERYVEAVARVLGVGGFAVHVVSDVPVGAGLASSAALTVATARALSDAFGLGLDDRAVALAAHRAESAELGIGSGVMDQFAAALGREREALLIDCRSLSVERVPLPGEAELLVVDSGVRHEHAAAAGYRERVAECRRAAELLGVASLRDVEPSPGGAGATLCDAGAIDALPAPLDRRVRHVVEENVRVVRAVAALEAGDLDALGAILREGHASLRDLYEVSAPEVDALVTAAEAAGALGARLTGGGFGGSIIALCRRGEAAAIGKETITRAPEARVIA